MSELLRRGCFETAGLATTGLALGRLSTGLAPEGGAPPTAVNRAVRPDFMHPIKPGQVFTSLDDARRASLQAGDVVLIRDLSKLAPTHVWTEPFVRGKWRLRPYRLADGLSGKLLMVHDFAGDEGPAAVPPGFEVKLDLPGWYAIWLGVPLMKHSADGGGMINVALEGEVGYAIIGPEATRFRGRWAHPFNCEYMCYWKCAQLDKQTLRIRVPWGTYSHHPWGMVRGCFSSLRLIRLSDQQTQAYFEDVADPSTKRGMVIIEGMGSEPGTRAEADMATAWRNTDVSKFMLQTPSTGVANWPSKATSLMGEMVSINEWKRLTKSYRKISENIQWAVRNEQESFRLAVDALKGSSTELHASLRMNLFEGGDLGKLFNGKFWFEHPEMRKPDSLQLDYAIPAVRTYITGILMELASNYDVSGVNMDFTRWPPVADPARHDFSLLLNFIKEVRRSLDNVQARKGRKLALSAHLVDDVPVYAQTMVGQKIDFDAWLATGVLDFVSVETGVPNEQKLHLSIAKRHGVPYYAAQDWGAKGMLPDEDPWLLAPITPEPDPVRADELKEQRDFDKQFGTGMDPTDYDRAFAVRYARGVERVCTTNTRCWRAVSRIGHVEEVKQRAAAGTIWGQEPGPKMTIS